MTKVPQQSPMTAAVKSYKEQVEARTAANKRPPLPDLSAAHEFYDPKRGLMTMQQMGEAQRQAAAEKQPEKQPENDGKPRLSEGSLAGLKALVEAQKAMASETAATSTPAAPPAEPTAATPEAAAKEAAAGDLDPIDEFDYEAGWRQTQRDILNNDVEREAVRKLVKPINIEDGLINNEFTQLVPIGPLSVEFRSLQPMEYATIRSMIFKMIDEGKLRDAISSEIHSLMMTVASVKAFNGKELPQHVVPEAGHFRFDETIFIAKVRRFEAYPGPVMHALGCHSAWFDLRCREFFRNGTALKNG